MQAQLKEATTLHIPVAMQRDTHNVSSLKASKQEAAQRLSELLSLQTQLEVSKQFRRSKDKVKPQYVACRCSAIHQCLILGRPMGNMQRCV
jgi:hypothetical protein